MRFDIFLHKENTTTGYEARMKTKGVKNVLSCFSVTKTNLTGLGMLLS